MSYLPPCKDNDFGRRAPRIGMYTHAENLARLRKEIWRAINNSQDRTTAKACVQTLYAGGPYIDGAYDLRQRALAFLEEASMIWSYSPETDEYSFEGWEIEDTI